ncbi:MAG: HAD-IIIA family hydrolase [Clostridia bacterium]|nr:HAD-IIIA family hydrolase [Clostridia bacterium]
MQAVIMAGGKGERLAGVTENKIPKPLVPFCGKPLIEHLIDSLMQNGITDMVICVGHLGEQIMARLGDGSRFGCTIHFVCETFPLGSAGALYYAKAYIREDFILVNADLLMNIDIGKMHAFHLQKNALATLFVHPNSHPCDSDIVVKDAENRVLKFDFKGTVRADDYENCTNAGVVIFKKNVLDLFIKPQVLHLERDVLSTLIQKGERIFAYHSPEYVKDIGTPVRLAEAVAEYESGKVTHRNLAHKQKAIFLDRDGTLNQFKGLITSPAQMELIEGVPEALKRINRSDYLALVVTNQPVLARGDCTVETLELIHKRLYTLLGNAGCYVDDLIYCPHHPDKGYAGEVKALKIDCACRKPKTGMVTTMAKKYNIDLSASYFIGDTYRDVQTGRNAGVKTVFIPSDADDEKTVFVTEPDFKAASLRVALDMIGIK